jgi:transposase InsO family protein
MQTAGIRAVARRRYRHTTDSKHDYPVAPNILERNFRVAGPDQVWLTDITYIPTEEGWLYLSAVMDLHSRRIIGWGMSNRVDRELTLDALLMALGRRRPAAGLLHHSDRGSQYACYDYQKLLGSRGMTCSMSRKGDPYDNAAMESFFRTLKVELVYRDRFRYREEAKGVLVEYIELFYNQQRRHSALGYLSPAEYERQQKTA